MIYQVLNTIEKYNMIKNGDRILIGVSGGVDSIVLLDVLVRIKARYNIDIIVAHLNHCLRGEDAEKDEQFVKSLSEKYGLKCYTKKSNMNLFAKENKISSEEAGRILRYSFFDELVKIENCNKIAIAHNKNDQAETILMRIFRGTGLDGLVGIKHVNNSIIRPILDCSRDEIEEYQKMNHLEYREDYTNSQTIYTRNSIRHEMIPLIKKEYNSNIIDSLCRMSNLIQDDLNIINTSVMESLLKLEFQEHTKMVSFNKEKFLELDIALQKRVVRYGINKVKLDLNGIEDKHIENILKLALNSSTGKKIDITDGLIARNNYTKLEILYKQASGKDFEFEVEIGSTQNFESFKIESYLEDKKNIDFYTKDIFLKFFDYDKMKCTIKIRNRRVGDKFIPLGMTGSKKIKDLFIDEKIEADKRDEIPIVVCGDEIVWVVGYRIGDKFKVTDKTEKVLVLKYIGIRGV